MKDYRNIDESLKSKLYIELKVSQKGTPFLNFEISKIGAGFLIAPACEEGAETSIGSLMVRDFCLSNMM
jgi:hypothetical protein